jgi:hypothetical protein
MTEMPPGSSVMMSPLGFDAEGFAVSSDAGAVGEPRDEAESGFEG